jgi:hypothetical protein
MAYGLCSVRAAFVWLNTSRGLKLLAVSYLPENGFAVHLFLLRQRKTKMTIGGIMQMIFKGFDRRRLLLCGAAAMFVPMAAPALADAAKLKVLIVDGASNHEWVLTNGAVLAAMRSSDKA